MILEKYFLTHIQWYPEPAPLSSGNKVDGGKPHEDGTKEVAVGGYCYRILLPLTWWRLKKRRRREGQEVR